MKLPWPQDALWQHDSPASILLTLAFALALVLALVPTTSLQKILAFSDEIPQD